MDSNNDYIPGKSYFMSNNGIEYIYGDLPIIISAPHGGRQKPNWLPDRKYGCFEGDDNTDILGKVVSQKIYNLTRQHPYTIINHLHRRKIDLNRDVEEGAQNYPETVEIWNQYHRFIETAKMQIEKRFKKGLFIDLHGQSHPIQRIELGYLLRKDVLSLSDDEIEDYKNVSSIRSLANSTNIKFAEIIRGEKSLGGLLQKFNYRCVPSPDDKVEKDEEYFNGGYNTRIHGSLKGGCIDGIQVECNYKGLRDSNENLEKFAEALSHCLIDFVNLYYDFNIHKN